MQHINVKIFAREDVAIDAHKAIEMFHRWIQNRVEDSLIDVADYSHVPAGPGVMLIGHDAFYSLDNREGRLGLLYNRRSEVEGSTQEKIRQAYDAALRACRRVERDLPVQFDDSRFEVFVNDRIVAPNEEATWKAFQPELASLFAGGDFKWSGASRDLFRVRVSL